MAKQRASAVPLLLGLLIAASCGHAEALFNVRCEVIHCRDSVKVANTAFADYLAERTKVPEFKRKYDDCLKEKPAIKCSSYKPEDTKVAQLDNNRCKTALFGSRYHDQTKKKLFTYTETGAKYGFLALEYMNKGLFCDAKVSDAQDYKLYLKDLANVVFDFDTIPAYGTAQALKDTCYDPKAVDFTHKSKGAERFKSFLGECLAYYKSNHIERVTNVHQKKPGLFQKAKAMTELERKEFMKVDENYGYTCMEALTVLARIQKHQFLFFATPSDGTFEDITAFVPDLYDFSKVLLSEYAKRCKVGLMAKLSEEAKWLKRPAN